MAFEELSGAQLLRFGGHALPRVVCGPFAQGLDALRNLRCESSDFVRTDCHRRTIGGKVLVFSQRKGDGLAATFVRCERSKDGVPQGIVLDSDLLDRLINRFGRRLELEEAALQARQRVAGLAEFLFCR